MNAALKSPKFPILWPAFWRWNLVFVMLTLVTNGNWFAHGNNRLPVSLMLGLAVWSPLLFALFVTGLQVLLMRPRPVALWRNIFVQVFGFAIIVGWFIGWAIALLPAGPDR